MVGKSWKISLKCAMDGYYKITKGELKVVN
jgi:hypothetical protein